MAPKEDITPQKESKNIISAPPIYLPEGSDAVLGIGEKLTSNPVTGTGSMSVPITVNTSLG